ncbi:hypothetical protein BN2475_720042 [Paraburkholderia ribeironis]|uniref:Uncharacterized protein n=1 Tax=Paraburkholderia ribeironis TaxID=1247936 RepID=A0A1N7SIS4_9BURK|nr:hypothetical protein BN2475_720042 [Paraburkholderia ribeironis]
MTRTRSAQVPVCGGLFPHPVKPFGIFSLRLTEALSRIARTEFRTLTDPLRTLKHARKRLLLPQEPL